MALILIGFALIALIDLTPLIRRRSWRGLAAFLLLFVPALTLAILQVNGIQVPSVMILLWKALKAIGLSY
jgi:hypothetical protein